MEIYGVIYKIEDKENQKVYIGQTKNFKRRMKEYRLRSPKQSKKYDYGIMRIIAEKGYSNFKFSIIHECKSKEELHDMEEYYIKEYDSSNPDKGYNSQGGGNNRKLNDKTRKLMSKSHTGMCHTVSTKILKCKRLVAVKDNDIIIVDGAKLFADYIGTDKGTISHYVKRGKPYKDWYLFYVDKQDRKEIYKKSTDCEYKLIYKTLASLDVETMRKLYNVYMMTYNS